MEAPAPRKIEHQQTDRGYVPVYATGVVEQPWTSYSKTDHDVWDTLFKRQRELLPGRACREFMEGVERFGLGDGGSTPNAKTAAAARKQAPIVAVNILSVLKGGEPVSGYDGYGSCPLTVEKGKIVLAEFGYGGKLLPSFPKWLIDGTQPQRLSWLLKSEALPWVYWNGMLKGHEWMVKPEPLSAAQISKAA